MPSAKPIVPGGDDIDDMQAIKPARDAPPMPGPLPGEMPISVEASVRHMFGLKRRLYLGSYRGKTEAKKRSAEAAFHAANAAAGAGAAGGAAARYGDYKILVSCIAFFLPCPSHRRGCFGNCQGCAQRWPAMLCVLS